MATDYNLIIKGIADFHEVETKIAEIKRQDIRIKVSGDTRTVTQTTSGVNALGQQITRTSTQVDQLNSSMHGMGQRFVDTTLKVAKFAASTAIIGAFTGAIASAVKAVREFDDAQTEFKKVSDLNGEALNDYSKKLGEMGRDVARTRTEMISAAT